MTTPNPIAPNPTAQTNPPAAPAADTDQIVEAAIAEISHIATLPEVTMKIIQLVEDPDSTAADLNNVISNDPALGARILKVVNSAFYGLPGQIGSINRAVVLLGLNAVKNIAIAASLAKLFRGGRISDAFDARDLWSHAIASATATRLLAEKISLGLPDEAFLAGLIHDLGVMVEIQARRAEFVQALESFTAGEHPSFTEAETAHIQASHQDFGAALCKSWKFPTSFQYVTGYHHRPWDLPPANQTLTSLVYVADCLTKKLGIGFTLPIDSDNPRQDVMTTLNLTEQDLTEVAEQLPEAIEEAKAIFAGV